jgi:hypothetical protein
LVQPYERQPDDPVYRPLRVLTLDPETQALDGSVATLNVPYEPLEPGPKGRLFEIVAKDGDIDLTPVNLEDPRLLLSDGVAPSPSDHRFHQQMVYAVCSSVYATFRVALGRHITWGFRRPDSKGLNRLRVIPHSPNEGANAVYDKERGELRFGYFDAKAVGTRYVPGAPAFTCLSHDVIVHELTHAMVDALRGHFLVASGPDVLGFHEGFADLVALFQHFTYPKHLERELVECQNNLREAALTHLAVGIGQASGRKGPLRKAFQENVVYDKTLEAHDMGSVLVAAIFDAFVKIYDRKTERVIKLATGGFTSLEGRPISTDLVYLLAKEASQLASQFLSICIRALDYCPPVDLDLGEFLRAMITADRDLVPDDKWGYREALIDSFAARGIFPPDVKHMAQDALLWRPTTRPVPAIEELSFANLRFQGDPSLPANECELRNQACALGRVITRPENLWEFGLADPQTVRGLDRPVMESIRTSRRIGPDGQVLFDLIAEVTQRRVARDPKTGVATEFYGGSTVIVGPKGEVRYSISKQVMSKRRLERQIEFEQRLADQLGRQPGRLTQREITSYLHSVGSKNGAGATASRPQALRDQLS